MAIPNPTVYYKLDSNANDSVGSNNGTATNVSWVAGKIGNAGSFNGTSSKIATPYNMPYASFSINMWVKENNNTGTQNFISWRQNGNGNPIVSIFNVSGTVTFRLRSAAGTGLTDRSATAGSTSAYHMYTFTYNSSSGAMEIYIDGSLSGTSKTYSGGTWSGIDSGRLGNEFINGEYLNGIIDEVGLWSTVVLSASEISELYNGGAGVTYPFGGTTVNSGFFSLM